MEEILRRPRKMMEVRDLTGLEGEFATSAPVDCTAAEVAEENDLEVNSKWLLRNTRGIRALVNSGREWYPYLSGICPFRGFLMRGSCPKGA